MRFLKEDVAKIRETMNRTFSTNNRRETKKKMDMSSLSLRLPLDSKPGVRYTTIKYGIWGI